MSGKPQVTINTQYYKIQLYKDFRRKVPIGSDYFKRNQTIFTELFLSKKNIVDSILEEENLYLKEFCPKTFKQESSKEMSTKAILANHDCNMHTIHINLLIVPKSNISQKLEIEIMNRIFKVFNTSKKGT